MPSPVDLTGLTAAITDGFADVVAAITANQSTVDLTDLTAEIKRVADALYVEDQTTSTSMSITQVAQEGNDQVGSVIGPDVNNIQRVRTDPVV